MRAAWLVAPVVLAACFQGGGIVDRGVDAGADAAPADASTRLRGLRLVAPWPASGELVHASMVLGASSDPIVAWVERVPNGSDVLRVARWDADRADFSVTRLDDVGDPQVAAPHREVSLARDPQTGAVGVAYQKETFVPGGTLWQIAYAESQDDGRTFGGPELVSRTTDPKKPIDDAMDPSLAMQGGARRIAWVQEGQGCVPTATNPCLGVLWASREGGAGWKIEAVPFITSAVVGLRAPVSVALDATGSPGVAYFAKAGANTALNFHHPGVGTTSVASSASPTKTPSVALRAGGSRGGFVAGFHLEPSSAGGDVLAQGELGNDAWLVEPTMAGTTSSAALAFRADGCVVVAAGHEATSAAACARGPVMVDCAKKTSCIDARSAGPRAAGWVSIEVTDSDRVVSWLEPPAAGEPGGLFVWRGP
jgi:hypothetical protein